MKKTKRFKKEKNRRARNTAKRKKRFIEGVLRMSSKNKGYVFLKDTAEHVQVEDGFFGTALNGDIVNAVVKSSRGTDRQFAHIEKVLVRTKTNYAGILKCKDDTSFYLKPQDTRMRVRIIIPKNKAKDAVAEQKVFVHLDTWNDPLESPTGEILKIIGKPNDNETEMVALLLDRGIESDFEKPVQKEAELIKKNEKETLETELQKRRDCRNIQTFTIDPKDAKDFDDALSYQTLPDGDIEIGVHIADVSHYIKPNTALDEVAMERGTSVYLVDRTIPMLPEILSNDICSLKPKEDKLAFSVFFVFSGNSVDKNGSFHIKKHSVEKTVINSDKRFTYEEAQQILNNGSGKFFEEIRKLNVLAKKIAKKDRKNGAISFSQEEVKFVLDKNKKPIDVYTKTMSEVNTLIESFMLLANKTVTEYIHKKVPEDVRLFMYRIHDKPDIERVLELVGLLHSLGYTLQLENGTMSQKELNRILSSTEQTPEANMIQMAAIRSMAKAVYSIQNIGHFGLGFSNYTHFTSPIRRYPDIIVHRLIKTYQDGRQISKDKWHTYQTLARELSEKEKNAMEAERNSIKFKQVEYMLDKQKEIFEGVITGVTEWGLFVEEVKTKAEGLIRIRELDDDYYIYKKEKMSLIGSRTKKQYRLGDLVKIKIKNVDLNNKMIEFQLSP